MKSLLDNQLRAEIKSMMAGNCSGTVRQFLTTWKRNLPAVVATSHNSLLEPIPRSARIQLNELLEDILRSVPFRTSRQCQELFRYIVEHSLSGAEDSLRERVIGVEVFELSRKVSNAGTSFSWTIVLILWMVFVEVVGEDKSLVSDGIHLHGSEILKF